MEYVKEEEGKKRERTRKKVFILFMHKSCGRNTLFSHTLPTTNYDFSRLLDFLFFPLFFIRTHVLYHQMSYVYITYLVKIT